MNRWKGNGRKSIPARVNGVESPLLVAVTRNPESRMESMKEFGDDGPRLQRKAGADSTERTPRRRNEWKIVTIDEVASSTKISCDPQIENEFAPAPQPDCHEPRVQGFRQRENFAVEEIVQFGEVSHYLLVVIFHPIADSLRDSQAIPVDLLDTHDEDVGACVNLDGVFVVAPGFNLAPRSAMDIQFVSGIAGLAMRNQRYRLSSKQSPQEDRRSGEQA